MTIQENATKTTLDNGLTVVSEYISYVRSVSIGVWVKTGSRFENEVQMGISHFLEHLMFKDTDKRSARDIVRTIESLGGMINAFTTKEYTCYHIEILDEYLPHAVDVLSDMLCRSGFPEKEFEKERNVILDEIYSMEDTPEEMVQELFMDKLFPKHSLGYSILGTESSVGSMKMADVMRFFQEEYRAENIVIAAAGNLKHKELVALVEKNFQFPAASRPATIEEPKDFGRGEFFLERPIVQSHICLGVPAISYNDPRRFDLLLLNTVLGGGMGARLFQNIRESHGIAYGIYSYYELYLDSGMFGIYLGTDQKNMSRALELLDEELNSLTGQPISEEELREAKSQLKGNIVLGLESTAARMNRMAVMEMYHQKFFSIDNVIEKIDATTTDSIQEIARELFDARDVLKVVFVAKN